MHQMTRKRWAVVAALVATTLGGACGLLEPHPRTEYSLVKVNGRLLPALAESTMLRHYTTGVNYILQLYVRKWSGGSLLLHGSDFEISTTSEQWFDGVSQPDFPPITDVDKGGFKDSAGVRLFFARQFGRFRGEFENDGATLILTDRDGAYDFAVFEFSRVAPP